MKSLVRYVSLATLLTCVLSFGQHNKLDSDKDNTSLTSLSESLPKISVDSTVTEITAHVDAMIKWMLEEHYKSKYVPILIYAEKGLYLAKKSGNPEHIHNMRSVVGNTLIRVKDTIKAKNLFLKSLRDAEKVGDSALILKYKGNMANIYYFTDGYKEKTINIYLESLEIARKLKDTTKLFILHHNLSRAFNETKKPRRSAYHIEKTEHYLNALDNPPHYQASHHHNKGRMLLLLNDPDEAIINFKKTISICKNTAYTEALIEGYEGYKDALEMKKDYKGVYEISKILEVYEEERSKDEAKNIIESVGAKLEVERFKEQIKLKELEKELLQEQAESKTLLLFISMAILVFISIILVQTYRSNIKRKRLIINLEDKNLKYLEAKRHSDELTKAKTKFFATVSHELRTPLYGVIGLSSILLENNELEKHENDLKSLKFSANYLLALINDLLHINKIETNTSKEEESNFDIRELTSTIISSFEYIRVQHQNTITINIPESIPIMLKGNSVKLSQILMNLIGNACKFTEKGCITLDIKKLEQDDKSVLLEFVVSDTGPGVEKTKLSEIFDEFTQIDSMSANYQGTGLGLPIVKKLIDQAGGTIDVESELGIGTTFTFKLKFVISNVAINNKTAPILDFKQLSNKHILIVEDNRINQTVTKRILENENVRCTIAQNGEEAVSLVKINTYDLILMDINMPVKNGIEASTEIRTFNSNVPIIALTAVEIEEQKYKIFKSGMNDIILKPYDIDLFKKTIIKNLLNNERNDFKKTAQDLF
ncbi:ATP-binding protein [Winogradskyella sp.]|uniref:ATP-binding protein n=1 Tax=Winogradskyella sp. TaxID=1883156 RepID=UPI003BACC7E2